jgi:hypothetical protein
MLEEYNLRFPISNSQDKIIMKVIFQLEKIDSPSDYTDVSIEAEKFEI